MSDSPAFAIEIESPGSSGPTVLGTLAEAMAPGSTIEFASGALPSAMCDNNGERVVYWNNKFYWDAERNEAQAIAIGTGFTAMTHMLYSASLNTWARTTPFDAPSVLACTNLGHPYSWHFMTPDGTYWCKRSTEIAFAYRRRSNWSTGPWAAASKTPLFAATSSTWPETAEWHAAMGNAIFRIGSTAWALDVQQFLENGTWGAAQLPIAPASTQAEYAAMGYCTALQSMICFRSAANAQCYRIRPDGSMETIGPVPRYVLNGNRTMTSADTNKYAMFVDDPRGLTGYLLERQPTDSTLPNRVWKMNNQGPTWDGTWSEIGTHELFHKARADGKAPGGTAITCSIPEYGVVWALRQRGTTYCDSFLWKPPA